MNDRLVNIIKITSIFDFAAFASHEVSCISTPLGAITGQRMNTSILPRALALLILATTIKIYSEIIM